MHKKRLFELGYKWKDTGIEFCKLKGKIILLNSENKIITHIENIKYLSKPNNFRELGILDLYTKEGINLLVPI